MWSTQPLETFVEQKLKEQHAVKGAAQWARYVELRTEMSGEILPWIATVEPELSDHGVDHIENVIENATQLLGLPTSHGDEVNWDLPGEFNVHELLLLLLGCLTHDVGNILGREKHNLAIGNAATLAGTGWLSYSNGDRRIIESIGRSHSGRTTDGGRDTLAALSKQPAFFAQAQVRLEEIAAVLRFADELAEGPQRTSAALLALTNLDAVKPEHRFSDKSRLYHLYAAMTTYHIDHAAGRILVDYDIDRRDAFYPEDDGERRALMRAVLAKTYARAVKLNAERQYARHYSKALSHFRETSISLRFYERGQPLDLPARTVDISDARTALETVLTLESIAANFALDDVLDTLFHEGS